MLHRRTAHGCSLPEPARARVRAASRLFSGGPSRFFVLFVLRKSGRGGYALPDWHCDHDQRATQVSTTDLGYQQLSSGVYLSRQLQVKSNKQTKNSRKNETRFGILVQSWYKAGRIIDPSTTVLTGVWSAKRFVKFMPSNSLPSLFLLSLVGFVCFGFVFLFTCRVRCRVSRLKGDFVRVLHRRRQGQSLKIVVDFQYVKTPR